MRILIFFISLQISLILIFPQTANSRERGELLQKWQERRSQRETPYQNTPSLNNQQKVLSDIQYGTHKRHVFDVYISENSVKNSPVIFMVHGGGWARGDKKSKRVVDNKVNYWLPKGYIFISVNYRFVPEVTPLDQAHDIAKALEFAQANVYMWGGNPNSFIIMGHSAGAHLIMLMASDKEITDKYNIRPWLGAVSLDSGALDVVNIMENKHYKLYDEPFGSDFDFWVKTSPLHRLAEKTPPALLVCSAKRLSPCPEAKRYADKLRSLGGQAQVLPISMSHGEINESLGSDASYTQAVQNFIENLY